MYEIKHKTSEAVLFTGDYTSLKLAVEAAVTDNVSLSGANLSGANLSGAYLRGANLSGANLSGANLRGANLGGADLTGADLGDAVLRGAELTGADLTGAYLGGAYLRGADLSGAYLSGIIPLGFPDGWPAWAICEKETTRLRISVGCHRDEPLSRGRAYWTGKEDRREVMAALDYAEAVAKHRGWVID